MFKNLEIKPNENLFETIFDYNKDEVINLIEKLLLNNKNILTIFINKDNSYSIYLTEDLKNDVCSSPIFYFNLQEDLSQVYYYMKLYIDLFSTTIVLLLISFCKVLASNISLFGRINLARDFFPLPLLPIINAFISTVCKSFAEFNISFEISSMAIYSCILL